MFKKYFNFCKNGVLLDACQKIMGQKIYEKITSRECKIFSNKSKHSRLFIKLVMEKKVFKYDFNLICTND